MTTKKPTLPQSRKVVELTAAELATLSRELQEHCRTSVPLEEWIRGSFKRFIENRITIERIDTKKGKAK